MSKENMNRGIANIGDNGVRNIFHLAIRVGGGGGGGGGDSHGTFGEMGNISERDHHREYLYSYIIVVWPYFVDRPPCAEQLFIIIKAFLSRDDDNPCRVN